MSALRSSLYTSTRPLLRSSRLPLLAHRHYSNPRTDPTGDYGSGKGSPVGEHPQAQGPNPSADKEHPGPPPPKAGHGSGSSPTKGTETGHNISASPLDQTQKRGFSRAGRRGFAHGKGTEGAQPKILNVNPPKAGEEPEDVRRHNEEMAKRVDRPDYQVKNEDAEKDKVSKGFWSGHGGNAGDGGSKH